MDRKEMTRTLDAWIATTYAHARADRRLPTGRNALKSYIIESDDENVAKDPDSLALFFSDHAAASGVQIEATDDPTLHQLRFARHNTDFFLDTLDPRFWILHTIASADQADGTIRRLVQRTPSLDSTWIPTQFMEEWSETLGAPRSVTCKFSMPMGAYLDSLPDEEIGEDSLFLRFSTPGDFRPRLRAFRESEQLASSLAVWAMRVTRRDNQRELVVHDDVTSGGKLTCRGNSFALHSEVVLTLKSQYSDLISDWEKTYRMGWQSDEKGLHPTGQAAELLLPVALDQAGAETFLATVFSGGEPYRLYGLPIQDGSGRFVVHGVDLHNGDRIDFELLPDVFRVYLHANSCGNVLARLLTNLQHFHDARVRLL